MQNQYEIEPVWVNPIELSRRTGIAAQTLANDRHQGRGFAYTKRGRTVLYFWPDVVDDLQRSKIRPEGR
jgi:hypothetical protein